MWPFTIAVLAVQLLRDLSSGGAVHNARVAARQTDHHDRQAQQLRTNLADQGLSLP